ncbi:MAG: hypothetical protein RLZZ244_1019 [Verrucomicrobiota bacterium]|jgi:phosphoribosylanthranilate isomerase
MQQLIRAKEGARVRIKICGITNERDALGAIEAGADALGLNTWRGSKRWVDLEDAREWVAALPPFVTRVALCVNESLAGAQRYASLPGVDCLQFHGEESRELCAEMARAGHPFIRALRLPEARDWSAELSGWSTRHLLLDAYVPGAYGGTGARVDWGLAAQAVSDFPDLSITLAGGLDPENVAEAVRRVAPYAVDVASGVESAPGRKDVAKMRDFVQAVRGA